MGTKILVSVPLKALTTLATENPVADDRSAMLYPLAVMLSMMASAFWAAVSPESLMMELTNALMYAGLSTSGSVARPSIVTVPSAFSRALPKSMDPSSRTSIPNDASVLPSDSNVATDAPGTESAKRNTRSMLALVCAFTALDSRALSSTRMATRAFASALAKDEFFRLAAASAPP